MINGNLTFNYNNYPLIYAAEPLLPFDPYAEKFIGDPIPFNFLICTVNDDTWIDNKCFLFTNVEMNDVVEKSLLPYLAESFTIGQMKVQSIELREHFFALTSGSKSNILSHNIGNQIRIYSVHNANVKKLVELNSSFEDKKLLDINHIILHEFSEDSATITFQVSKASSEDIQSYLQTLSSHIQHVALTSFQSRFERQFVYRQNTLMSMFPTLTATNHLFLGMFLDADDNIYVLEKDHSNTSIKKSSFCQIGQEIDTSPNGVCKPCRNQHYSISVNTQCKGCDSQRDRNAKHHHSFEYFIAGKVCEDEITMPSILISSPLFVNQHDPNEETERVSW